VEQGIEKQFGAIRHVMAPDEFSWYLRTRDDGCKTTGWHYRSVGITGISALPLLAAP
jgi:hypothetical protein